MAIDLERVRAFMAVVEADGFQAAARQLRRAQPWLSVQIRQLEEALGFALIVRGRGRGITLTPHGAKFLPLARQAVQAFEDMKEGARQIARPEAGRLRVGADPFSLHVPERNILLARFVEEHPEVELTIHSASPAELYEQLEQGELDLIIATDPDPGRFRAERLCSYTISLLVPEESRWAGREEVDLAEFAYEQVLTVHQEYSPRFMARLRDYFAAAGVRLGYAPEPGYVAVLRYAQVSRRPAVTTNFSALFHEVPSDMRFCRIAGEPLLSSWYIVAAKGRPESPAQRQFRLLGAKIAANPAAAWRR